MALERVVILVDMDCFYCQVEEQLDPNLRGKPIAVVQYNAWRGGGIIAVNYPARDLGVTRHMRGNEAKQKCPGIELVRVPQVRGKADLTKYREAGKKVAEVLQTFTSALERASVDEAYLDITELIENRMNEFVNGINIERLPNTFVVGSTTNEFLESSFGKSQLTSNNMKLAVGAVISEEIRAAVFEKTGYKCSAGIAHNKILAKLVCGLHKPNKQTILPHDALPELYKDLPVRKIKSLGGKFGNTMSEVLGITYMGELMKFTERQLIQKFDEKTGIWLYNIARGIDMEPVTTRLVSKSIGCCKKFPGQSALLTPADVEHWIKELAQEIAERLDKDIEENNRRAKQMVVSFAQKVKGKDISSSRTHPLNSYESQKITQNAIDVIRRFCMRADGTYHIIFLGISVGSFEDIKNVKEITSFFKVAAKEETNKKVETTGKISDQKFSGMKNYFSKNVDNNGHNSNESSGTEKSLNKMHTTQQSTDKENVQDINRNPKVSSKASNRKHEGIKSYLQIAVETNGHLSSKIIGNECFLNEKQTEQHSTNEESVPVTNDRSEENRKTSGVRSFFQKALDISGGLHSEATGSQNSLFETDEIVKDTKNKTDANGDYIHSDFESFFQKALNARGSNSSELNSSENPLFEGRTDKQTTCKEAISSYKSKQIDFGIETELEVEDEDSDNSVWSAETQKLEIDPTTLKFYNNRSREDYDIDQTSDNADGFNKSSNIIRNYEECDEYDNRFPILGSYQYTNPSDNSQDSISNEISGKTAKSLETVSDRPDSASYFQNYFCEVESPVKRDFDTSKILEDIKSENSSEEESEVTEKAARVPLNTEFSEESTENQNFQHLQIDSEDNRIQAVESSEIGKEKCPQCNKLIEIEDLVSHMDYHYALQIVKEESSLYKSEPKPHLVVNNKSKKSTKRKNHSSSSSVLKSFLQKDSMPDSESEICQECNRRIKLSEIADHVDYHAAKKLHLEINSQLPNMKNKLNINQNERVKTKIINEKSIKKTKPQRNLTQSNISIASFFRPT